MVCSGGDRYHPEFSFYHIVYRRNHREALFLDPGDFRTFFYILQKVYEKIPIEPHVTA